MTDMVRADSRQLRPVAGDSAGAEAIKVAARAHQTLIWERTRPRLDPATAHLGLAPTRKAGADQTWPVLIRKRSTPGVRRAWAGRKNDQPLAQMPAQLVNRVQTQCTGQR
jgi:hypothetical protein